MTPDQSSTLTRVDERTHNTDKLLEAHIDDDHQRFERTFAFVKESFDKIDKRFDRVEDRFDERFDRTDAKLATLWDERNRTDGAFGMGKWMAGCVGGAVASVVSWLVYAHGGK